ncbi:MAG: HupE/UreJ family protein [Chitinophagales bacterium]|nr:HupE/UreJ family protein [Hyphomicrobiales bacterium]
MSSNNLVFRFIFGFAALLLPTAAYAHVGHGDTVGFMHGFEHPIGGVDHVLAMVAVGMFAANIGGRGLWAVPLTFVAVMAAGGVLAIAGVAVPFVEMGIALSVVVLGLVVAAQWKSPVALAMLLVGAFAIFHGYAHGAEMPADTSGAAYAAGFMSATSLLHMAGIALGLGVAKIGNAYWARTAQFGGAAISIAGVAILTGTM